MYLNEEKWINGRRIVCIKKPLQIMYYAFGLNSEPLDSNLNHRPNYEKVSFLGSSAQPPKGRNDVIRDVSFQRSLSDVWRYVVFKLPHTLSVAMCNYFVFVDQRSFGYVFWMQYRCVLCCLSSYMSSCTHLNINEPHDFNLIQNKEPKDLVLAIK